MIQRILAVKGINVSTADEEGRTMLSVVVQHSKNDEIIEWLLANGADVRIHCRGFTPLHLAVLDGNMNTIRALIDRGADVNVTGPCGITPFTEAFSRGRTDIAELLIQSGAHVSSDSRLNIENPLHVAVSMDWSSIVDGLITQGYDINSVDRDGETALHKAVFGNHPDTVDTLLYRGANVDACAFLSDGNTPLMLAAELDHERCASVLIDWGADIKKKDPHVLTALVIALESESCDVANLLLQYDRTPIPAELLEAYERAYSCKYDADGALISVDRTYDLYDISRDSDDDGGDYSNISGDIIRRRSTAAGDDLVVRKSTQAPREKLSTNRKLLAAGYYARGSIFWWCP